MAKTIDTIVEDIYGLFGTEEQFSLDFFHQFGENLKELMDVRFHGEKKAPHLRMSNLGKPDRQLWYDMNSKEAREEFSPQNLIKFAYGDIIEQMILMYAKMAGHVVEREQNEVEVDGIKGHLDCVIDGVVVDVKSASSFSFAKFESGAIFLPGNDPFGYVAQLAGYIEAVNPGGRGGFLAVDKTLGKVCFCEIPRDILLKYKIRDRIVHIREVVAQENPPARCEDDKPDGKSGNRKLGTLCSYCPHKKTCWPDLKTYYYSNGPRYLTKVVKEPRVGGEHNDFDDMP